MESKKMVLMILLSGQQRRLRQKEHTCGYSWGRRCWDKWRQLYGNIYITICKIDGQWKFAVYCREPKVGAL